MGVFALIGSLFSDGLSYFKERQKQKHETKMAVERNRQRLAESEQTHNQKWELRQLENNGWKDDVLFYAAVGFFVWTGFNPEGAKEVIKAWEVLPDWFLQTWGWIVASVVGVHKLGDSLPALLKGCKDVLKGGK